MKTIHLPNTSAPAKLSITRFVKQATQIRVEDNMEIILDRPRCEGHGLCEEVAPQLMHLDDEGELVLDVVHVSEDQLDAAKQAARVCPVAALRLA
jgi:ferredoxin